MYLGPLTGDAVARSYTYVDEARIRAEFAALPAPPAFRPDPLLIGYRDRDIDKCLESRWRKWRFRNRPDYFKIARMEATLGLEPTTDPATWDY